MWPTKSFFLMRMILLVFWFAILYDALFAILYDALFAFSSFLIVFFFNFFRKLPFISSFFESVQMILYILVYEILWTDSKKVFIPSFQSVTLPFLCLSSCIQLFMSRSYGVIKISFPGTQKSIVPMTSWIYVNRYYYRIFLSL